MALRQRSRLATTVMMEDGATMHMARYVKNVIQANFPNELVISHIFSIAWPARSPDLNPRDFWQGYFLKYDIY